MTDDLLDKPEALAPLLANAISECMNCVVFFLAPRLREQIPGAVPPEHRKNEITSTLWALVALRPRLGEVRGPPDLDLPHALDVAADLERALADWDGEAAPSAMVVKLANDFLATFGLPEPPGGWEAFEGPRGVG